MSVLFAVTFGTLFLALLPGMPADSAIVYWGRWNADETVMIVCSAAVMYRWMSRSRPVARSAAEIFEQSLI